MEKEEYEEEYKRVNIQQNGELKQVTIPAELLEKWDKRADEMNITRSDFVRVATTVGINTLDKYDPTTTSKTDSESTHLNEVIMNHVEVGEENAKSVEEIADDVAASVVEEALELLFNAKNIEESKNRFYKI